MVGALAGALGDDRRVIVGPRTGDDGGVFSHAGRSWVATTDFITPVCDDPRRFGRVAAANAISDVWAMGGAPLFALNVCCFPAKVPGEMLAEILAGGAELAAREGAAILGGHTVCDDDLKYGLAVTGELIADRPLTLGGARDGDALVLTKPIGTGVLINAYRKRLVDDDGLAPALDRMEESNGVAARAALRHGSNAATDVTGFGLARHLFGMCRASGVSARISLGAIPLHGRFLELVTDGVSTASTRKNRESVSAHLRLDDGVDAALATALFDPQTSGGLLIAVAEAEAAALVAELRDEGRCAALVGQIHGSATAEIEVVP